ncbi:hypothetical protein [Gracilimonas sediminicola]|uniref:hypothetical protein n=1 Tax=Gracilimonas sediminicola TaxID=2952158 RepID=UPI0038D35F27
MYSGKKGCPGCGVSGAKKSRTKADDLCRDCKKALEDGYKLQKEVDEDRYMRIVIPWYSLKEMSLRLYDDESRGYKQTKRTDSIPYQSHIGADAELGSTKQLTADFTQLINQLSVQKLSNRKEVAEVWCNDSKDGYLLPYGVGMALFRFIDSVAKHMNRGKRDAFNDMRTWLFKLNSGELTLDDFEEKVNRQISKS